MKKKISITRPLYWFCFLIVDYIVVSFFVRISPAILSAFGVGLIFIKSSSRSILVTAISRLLVAFTVLTIYIKGSKQRLINPEPLNYSKTVILILKYLLFLCIIGQITDFSKVDIKRLIRRLELSKYCPRCGKHTTHKEKK